SNLPLRMALAGLFVVAVMPLAQQSRDASLTVRILDGATGSPTPARVRLEDAQGNRPRARGAVSISESAIPIPRQAVAVMWGQNDRAQGYALQPDGSFYADGGFEARVPAGSYRLRVSKGFEYGEQTLALELAPGGSATREVLLTRWIDMPARGWYSSDDHIHLRRSPADDPKILKWVAAEDIHVGNILEMGDFWATYFSQYAFGERGRYQEGGRILSAGQEEPRTPEIGHTISLGAREMVRMQRDYYSYDRLFDRVHELGGLAGFAHQGFSFHAYRGMVLNTLAGKTDFLELAQFCVPEGPLPVKYYYHFLDLGFRLTALAGSDFPWCGKGVAQIGNARFYTYTGEPALRWDAWFAAMKAGHTFVTTGPMLLLEVNGHRPGDAIDIAPGTKVRVKAEAFGPTLKRLEIVGHGKTLQAMGPASGRLSMEMEVTPAHGMWIAAKCEGADTQFAHTTPVYVTVNGDGFQNPETAKGNVALSEEWLKEIEADLANPAENLDAQAGRHRAELQRQIAVARGRLKGLRTN
ncbi:MAG TPA: CehA/McbA family metallohydrolase, partial [Candidatus Sulfopaludibacter sp.]|nr:CehA/McbA family metallohydrolase [Candidatus Sulfopaludibacter sp.]